METSRPPYRTVPGVLLFCLALILGGIGLDWYANTKLPHPTVATPATASRYVSRLTAHAAPCVKALSTLTSSINPATIIKQPYSTRLTDAKLASNVQDKCSMDQINPQLSIGPPAGYIGAQSLTSNLSIWLLSDATTLAGDTASAISNPQDLTGVVRLYQDLAFTNKDASRMVSAARALPGSPRLVIPKLSFASRG